MKKSKLLTILLIVFALSFGIFAACGEDEYEQTAEAAAFISSVADIGTVSLDSKAKIELADSKYAVLSGEDKAYEAVIAAKTVLDAKSAEYNLLYQAAAANAEAFKTAVTNIGTVALSSETDINAAMLKYDALTPFEKELSGVAASKTALDLKFAELADLKAADTFIKAVADIDLSIFTGTENTFNVVQAKITAAENLLSGLTPAQKSAAGVSAAETSLNNKKTQFAIDAKDFADAYAAAQFKAKADAIGTVSLQSLSLIEAAEASYDLLTPDQILKPDAISGKTIVDNAKIAYNTLVKAAADKVKADEFIAFVNLIGTVDKNSGSKITDAENSYSGLTADQKAVNGVSGANTILQNARIAYDSILAGLKNDFISKVTDVGAVNDLTLSDENKTKISGAFTSYGALITAQLSDNDIKAAKNSLDELKTAFEGLIDAQAQSFIAAVGAITVIKASKECDGAITGAYALYNGLYSDTIALSNVQNAKAQLDSKEVQLLSLAASSEFIKEISYTNAVYTGEGEERALDSYDVYIKVIVTVKNIRGQDFTDGISVTVGGAAAAAASGYFIRTVIFAGTKAAISGSLAVKVGDDVIGSAEYEALRPLSPAVGISYVKNGTIVYGTGEAAANLSGLARYTFYDKTDCDDESAESTRFTLKATAKPLFTIEARNNTVDAEMIKVAMAKAGLYRAEGYALYFTITLLPANAEAYGESLMTNESSSNAFFKAEGSISTNQEYLKIKFNPPSKLPVNSSNGTFLNIGDWGWGSYNGYLLSLFEADALEDITGVKYRFSIYEVSVSGSETVYTLIKYFDNPVSISGAIFDSKKLLLELHDYFSDKTSGTLSFTVQVVAVGDTALSYRNSEVSAYSDPVNVEKAEVKLVPGNGQSTISVETQGGDAGRINYTWELLSITDTDKVELLVYNANDENVGSIYITQKHLNKHFNKTDALLALYLANIESGTYYFKARLIPVAGSLYTASDIFGQTAAYEYIYDAEAMKSAIQKSYYDTYPVRITSGGAIEVERSGQARFANESYSITVYVFGADAETGVDKTDSIGTFSISRVGTEVHFVWGSTSKALNNATNYADLYYWVNDIKDIFQYISGDDFSVLNENGFKIKLDDGSGLSEFVVKAGDVYSPAVIKFA